VTVYGTKTCSDQHGEYQLDNQPIGKRREIDVILDFCPTIDPHYLDAAMRLSPQDAVVKHLTHLSMHKKFGHSDKEIAVKLLDYAAALGGYPEWVVWVVCKGFWEGDSRPFVPFIDEMKKACQIVMDAFGRRMRPAPALEKKKLAKEPPSRKDRPRSQWTQTDWSEYVAEAEGMLQRAIEAPQFLDVEGWKAEVVKRELEKAERDAAVACA
jgi:hypothetical protein